MVKSSKNKEAAIGSQNRTVGPNEAKSALTHCIKLQRPIMMWGAPGIGKSDIVKQNCQLIPRVMLSCSWTS
jgi:MoxR-like ATPase